VFVACALALGACRGTGPVKPVTKEELGKRLFEDTTLSQPAGQACADCHVASAAFADPEDDRTSAGAMRDRFGARNAQSAMYAAFVPPLHKDASGKWVGGLFWDGRAHSLEDQAAMPLLNPLEMNNPDKSVVVAKVRKRYGEAFRGVFGKDALANDDVAFATIGEALAAFERTKAVSPFSSKYDRVVAGRDVLNESETRGKAVFDTHCTSCHAPPLFTNHAYVNLGMPRFNDNPYYELPAPLNPDGPEHIDHGLAATTHDDKDDGKFRVPSLRNVARTTPYGHNGYYRRLDEMISFHAKAAANPEVPATVDRSGLAGFKPSTRDIVDLVAFLSTLTDDGVR
jgi:cytochrome c peroxidase